MDRRRTSPLHVCASALILGLLAHTPAIAASIVYDVNFSSPTESFWGPGESAASFGFDQFILGNSSFGMRFQTGASTGTVSSHYNGALSLSYNALALPGLVPLTLSYQGDASGGQFDTLLGAFVKVTAYFPVIGDVTVTNPNYSLDTTRTYTPSPPDAASDSDSFTPASSAIGPDIGVGSAQAGIDYDIVQNSTHTITALTGTAIATNQTSGAQRSAQFSLGSSLNLFLNLDEPGVWDVQLTSLSLDNVFATNFDLAFVPFIQYTLGIGCGDAGDNDDNGPFCGGDGRLDRTLTHIDLFSNTPFALNLTSSNLLPSFQITVDAQAAAAVPEPGTFGALGVGLLALSLAARRRRLRAIKRAA
jgi:hypothetical protein